MQVDYFTVGCLIFCSYLASLEDLAARNYLSHFGPGIDRADNTVGIY